MPRSSTSSNPVGEADALIAAGQPQSAVEILQRVLASGRGGLMTRLALGRAHLAAGNIDSALRELRIASDLGSGIADAALALGQGLIAAGHLPAAVAEFGMLLRDSQHKGDASFDEVLELARKSLGKDGEGHRAELVRLVETAKRLSAGRGR